MKLINFQGDKVIWMVVLILTSFSLLAIYSSTGLKSYLLTKGHTEHFLIKQFFIAITGLIIMYIVHRTKYKYFSGSAQILIFISIALMIITLKFGVAINGEKRSLPVNLGIINFTIQTADFAKIVLIMYLARFIQKNQKDLQAPGKVFFFGVIAPVYLLCGLIMIVNLSTALILFAASIILLFIGNASIKNLITMVTVGIIGLAFVISVSTIFKIDLLPRWETWTQRFTEFFDKEAGTKYDQVFLAKTAIANGGLTGTLPGKSTQRYELPLSFSDYIYAIIIEEYGLIGGSFVLLMFIILLFRTLRIARLADKKFGSFLALGISFLMVLQAMVNMGVAVSLLPVTGQTLPFVSLGGTSFWFSCAAIGMILSVSRSMEETNSVDIKKNIYATA
jgi:cell division protein FtsW